MQSVALVRVKGTEGEQERDRMLQDENEACLAMYLGALPLPRITRSGSGRAKKKKKEN